jgi:hypothetical protein
MTIRGSCHCGAVRVTVPRAPEWVGDCNCSLCRKLGTLTVYYPDAEVSVEGETVAYVWGDRMIGLHHCPTCGCFTHWKTLGENFGKMGVSARLLDGFDPKIAPTVCTFAGAPIDVRLLDNREG